jgi:Lon protease-like protein
VSDLAILPIFPLPDVTFFPHTFLPLHVFETRYRAMVTDALARDRSIAVVRLRPGYEAHYEGKPEVFAVAGAGQIVNCERLASGRFNILVRGQWRVRIESEIPSDTLYRMVRARRLADGPEPAEAPALVSRIRSTCKRLLEALDRPVDVLEGALGADESPGTIADRVAAAFLPDSGLRQSLLETTDVGDRLRRVATALDDLANDLKGGRA